MSRANTVTIDHLEVRKTAIDKVKRFFNIKDDSEAINVALDVQFAISSISLHQKTSVRIFNICAKGVLQITALSWM